MEAVRSTLQLGRDPDLAPVWSVIFRNDSITPAGFAAYLLNRFFGYGEVDAMNLALRIHRDGSAVVGRYMKPIAELMTARAAEVVAAAGYPLEITLKKDCGV